MAEERTVIKEMPSEERPREKLVRYGVEVLSNVELLALLLRTGSAKESAIDLGHKLLKEFEGLKGLAKASMPEMAGVFGIGETKASQIQAAFELGRRYLLAEAEDKDSIHSPQDIADRLMPRMRDQTVECFVALLLDTKNRVLKELIITQGTLNASLIHPRELFNRAIAYRSAAVIVAHNHPSGDPTPSQEDIAVTRRLKDAGELLGIGLLDHLIVGDGRFVSMRERGLL
ncbi:MAG: DNA repair protein RadC [Armatimonadetes bacterium]|nr:DNA repair protein RadC [Armatimonadota bacterium]